MDASWLLLSLPVDMMKTQTHAALCLRHCTWLQTAAGTVLAQGQMAASRAAEDLRSNIRDEQELYNHFLMAVRSLLSPLQSAIAISHVRALSTLWPVADPEIIM